MPTTRYDIGVEPERHAVPRGGTTGTEGIVVGGNESGRTGSTGHLRGGGAGPSEARDFLVPRKHIAGWRRDEQHSLGPTPATAHGVQPQQNTKAVTDDDLLAIEKPLKPPQPHLKIRITGIRKLRIAHASTTTAEFTGQPPLPMPFGPVVLPPVEDQKGGVGGRSHGGRSHDSDRRRGRSSGPVNVSGWNR